MFIISEHAVLGIYVIITLLFTAYAYFGMAYCILSSNPFAIFENNSRIFIYTINYIIITICLYSFGNYVLAIFSTILTLFICILTISARWILRYVCCKNNSILIITNLVVSINFILIIFNYDNLVQFFNNLELL